MTWVDPGGVHAADKTQQITRITSHQLHRRRRLRHARRYGRTTSCSSGARAINLTPTTSRTGRHRASGHFEQMNHGVNDTTGTLDVVITDDNIPEGLNIIKARAFNQRDLRPTRPLQHRTKVVYVDRHGPELEIDLPRRRRNRQRRRRPDRSATPTTPPTDDRLDRRRSPTTAHEIMKGPLEIASPACRAGDHTIRSCPPPRPTGRPAQADQPERRTTRTSPSRANRQLDRPEPRRRRHDQQLPFFKTSSRPRAPDDVRLYWDGYELPFNGGGYTNIFNGEVVFDADPANVVTDRLWGAFINGQHFFEAVRVDGGVTSRVVAARGLQPLRQQPIDSDGDALPDNVEMPYFDSDGAPGPTSPGRATTTTTSCPKYGETLDAG